MELLVFSDLDGTLLDHHSYSWRPAEQALAALRQAGVPLVLCSSKTRAEILVLWEELGLKDPFISENGGGIFAPEGNAITGGDRWEPGGPGWRMIALGRPVEELRRAFEPYKAGLGAHGFADLSDTQVARLTGLSLESAALARQREFNEPIWLEEPEKQAGAFMAAAQKAGLRATRGGRFFHLLGGGDKGKAVRLLSGLYRRAHPDLRTAALGDSANDLPMLQAVDIPIQVALPDGSHAPLEGNSFQRTELPGPQGWNQAVLGMLAGIKAS